MPGMRFAQWGRSSWSHKTQISDGKEGRNYRIMEEEKKEGKTEKRRNGVNERRESKYVMWYEMYQVLLGLFATL